MNAQLIESLAGVINSLTPEEQEFLAIKTKQIKNNLQPPFYETATTEEWIKSFEEWANTHDLNTPILSDYAVSRESIYRADD